MAGREGHQPFVLQTKVINACSLVWLWVWAIIVLGKPWQIIWKINTDIQTMRVASRRQFAPKSRLQIAPKLMLRFSVAVVGLEIVAEVRFGKHTFAIFENHTQPLVVLHCIALLLLLMCACLCILLLLEQWSEWKAFQALCVVLGLGFGVEGRGIPLACCLFIAACASFLP